jgi:DNA-binding transcriptional LysR family regulator
MEIEADLAQVIELRDSPPSTVRVSATDYVANAVLWPRLALLLPRYPDIKIEITTDYGLTDIVAERFDIGVRLGNQVAQDMIAARVGPDLRMAMVASPTYLQAHPVAQVPDICGVAYLLSESSAVLPGLESRGGGPEVLGLADS